MPREPESVGDIVRALVSRIPKGRATSYGAVGRAAAAFGRPIGGARTVAWILAGLRAGEPVPWHRVVGARGVILLPDRRGALQRSRLRKEGVSFVDGTVSPQHYLDETALIAVLQKRRARR